MQSWLEGRIWVEKCAQATGITVSLRILSSKADSNTWESFTKSELKLEWVHQESPRSHIFRKTATSHFWNRNIVRSILPGLKRKITGLLLSGPKSSFQMKVNFVFHLEIKVPESEGGVERHRIHVAWSPVWSFQSVMIWAAMSSAGVGPLCFLKSTANAVIYQEILEPFMLPSADKHYGNADFISQQDMAPAHAAKGTKSWFKYHGVTVLDCPANSPDLNPIESMEYCQEEDERHQTKQCRWPEGRYQSNLGFDYTWAVPQADCLHATPHWCSNSCKRRPYQVLSA